MISGDEFDAMCDSAYLINVFCGSLVNEEVFDDALESKRIARAGLSVFEEESLLVESPL
jgi:phosphoglycerate dehydrogenase-like enzyme